MLEAAAAVVVGVVLLAWAADRFVVGAARLAALLRVAPLVIGVVIVGFGTSTPEMLVSALAAARGETGVSFGNIVGSNIVNLTLILGVGVLIFPLAVDSKTVRREAPITVAGMGLFALLAPGGIGRLAAMVLLLAMAAAVVSVLRRGDGDALAEDAVEFIEPSGTLGREVLWASVGLAGTLAGAQLLLTGALDLAEIAGLDSGFVGATIVAVGTSLPELVTVIQSARRGEGDLILGNLLGSNLFNALAVGGVAGIVGGDSLTDTTLTVGAPIGAVAIGLLVWWMMATGRTVSRREGVALVVVYLAAVPLLA